MFRIIKGSNVKSCWAPRRGNPNKEWEGDGGGVLMLTMEDGSCGWWGWGGGEETIMDHNFDMLHKT
jgi:hypothetical protein